MSGAGRGNFLRSGVLNPSTGAAHRRDPRTVPQGENPYLQPDQEQFGVIRDELNRNAPMPYSQEVGRANMPDLSARTVPTRVNIQRWTLVTTAGNTNPFLIVPFNPARVSLLIGCNGDAAPNDWVVVSFGAPPLGLGGTFSGTRLTGTQYLKFDAGVCPIDDIWIWTGRVASQEYTAFEGVEAVEQGPG